MEACHIVAVVVVVRHTASAVEAEGEGETKHIHTDSEERIVDFVVVEMHSQER